MGVLNQVRKQQLFALSYKKSLIRAFLLRKRRFPAGHTGPPQPHTDARKRQLPARCRGRSGVRAAPSQRSLRADTAIPRNRYPQPHTAARQSHSRRVCHTVAASARRSRGLSGALQRMSGPRGTNGELPRGLPTHRPPTLAQRRVARRTCTAPPLGCSCPSPLSWCHRPGSRRKPWRDGDGVETEELPWRRQRRFEPRTARPGQSAAAPGHHGTGFQILWAARAVKGSVAPSRRRHRGWVRYTGLGSSSPGAAYPAEQRHAPAVCTASTARRQQDNVWSPPRLPLTPTALRAARLLACYQFSTVTSSI